MIVIDRVEKSKDPVQTGEVFLIRVTAREVLTAWDEVRSARWGLIRYETWNDVERNGRTTVLWETVLWEDATQQSQTWGPLVTKTWYQVARRRKI